MFGAGVVVVVPLLGVLISVVTVPVVTSPSFIEQVLSLAFTSPILSALEALAASFPMRFPLGLFAVYVLVREGVQPGVQEPYVDPVVVNGRVFEEPRIGALGTLLIPVRLPLSSLFSSDTL